MNKNETLTLWISVAAAVFAAFLIFSYTQEKTKEISKVYGVQTTVITAAQPIYEMQTIQEYMVQPSQIPEEFVQPGYVRQMEDVVGMVALAPINPGEQILSNKVIAPGPETGLSLQVSPGKRALTVPVNEKRAVARLLKPGDRVDMLVAIDMEAGGGQKRYIKTLMQDVVILAAGLRIAGELPRIREESDGGNYIKNLRTENIFNTLTLEATPMEAQKIIYLLSTNPEGIYFTLRHPSDNSFLELRQTGLADVLGGGVTRTPAQKKPDL